MLSKPVKRRINKKSEHHIQMPRFRKPLIDYKVINQIALKYVPSLLENPNKIARTDYRLFKDAVTHSSLNNEIKKDNSSSESYERLEFLGDAVFHMIITEYLFFRYDEENEGFLTKLRIKIERGDSMVDFTEKLGLDKFIMAANITDKILEDVFEAFVGAFYLNYGIEYTCEFIVNLLEKHKNLAEIIDNDDNYKDVLLQYYHKMKWGDPKYINKKLSDDERNSKKTPVYRCTVRNPDDRKLGTGTSNSKKKAEQISAKMALVKLGVIVGDRIDPDWVNKLENTLDEEREKNKKKNVDKSLPIYNPGNKLMKKTDIRSIFADYQVTIPKNIHFDIKPFYEAMAHRSYLFKRKLSPEEKEHAAGCVKLQKKSNDRFCFLGNSITHFVISEYLYHKYPEKDEGFMTRLRAKMENRAQVYHMGVQTTIQEYLLISQNIEVLHGRDNESIISRGFEAFIGALYTELGHHLTKEFFLQVIRYDLSVKDLEIQETNYKDLVIQTFRQKKWGNPEFRVIKAEGPDHRKVFTIGIYRGNTLLGKGKESSKKKAEQLASKNMIENQTVV